MFLQGVCERNRRSLMSPHGVCERESSQHDAMNRPIDFRAGSPQDGDEGNMNECSFTF